MKPGSVLVDAASNSDYSLPNFIIPKKAYPLAENDETKFAAKFLKKAKLAKGDYQRSGFAYALSKNFVVWYAQKCAFDYGKNGIRVCSLALGLIDTGMGEKKEHKEGKTMICFPLSLASKTLWIQCFEERSKDYCKDFIPQSYSHIDQNLILTKEDIEDEKIKEGNKPFYGSLELSALYRKIAEYMIQENTLLFHGSALEIDGKAYIFAAPSGTGKSTHAKLLMNYIGPEKVTYINDDKPLLKITDKNILVYGTPWNGKERKSRNISAPLRGIALLKRSACNSIQQINSDQAYPYLLRQIYRSENPKSLQKTLALTDILVKRVPIYQLSANMEKEAAKCSYKGMIKQRGNL